MKKITLTFILFFTCIIFTYAQQISARESADFYANNQAITTQLTPYNYNISIVENANNSNTYSNEDILTVSLTENNTVLNPNNSTYLNFPSRNLLVWGNNNASIAATELPVTVNLSAEVNSDITTNVSYKTMQRVWKFIPSEEQTPSVTLSIPQELMPNFSNDGHYYMFISDTELFDIDAEFKIMTLDGSGNLTTDYQFNETSYITFGFSPQIEVARSMYFEGSDSYMDMQNTLDLNPDGFTLSAWIKHNGTGANAMSILSKRDVAFSQGYDLSLTEAQTIKIEWQNSSTQSLESYTAIPSDKWHHIAVTYNGNKASIYIDGVLDNFANKTAPVGTDEAFFIAAAGNDTPTQFYKGHIDEVRIWNTYLTENQIRFMMNQEITNNSGQVSGKELPLNITKNEVHTIPWSDLAAYYPMSGYTYRMTVDATGNNNHGLLKQQITIAEETAPIPYKSVQNGEWDHNTTWLNGSVQDTPGSTALVNPNVTIDWNIVKTSHNLSLSNTNLPLRKQDNRTLLGLYVDENELVIEGDNNTNTGNGLTITHYLSLTGKIDLEGESQLIQTLNSDLDVISNGKIERDQQGTADTYTYNYWSSPVTKTNSTVNNYKVSDVMKDGTIASDIAAINFSSSGYNGAATQPITIADYWIWKYSNLASDSYSAWQHIRRTGTILPGEGFTMKGPGTGSVTSQQNYVFTGQPNNGNINLTLNADNDYLVGNPYPSAIDAIQFIIDNGPSVSNAEPLISGTLYFWNHWGGGSHILEDYEGGYATRNFSGAVAAAYKGSNHPDIGTSLSPTKKPGQYISVGQGFFVSGVNSGTINFNNGQRVFKKENTASVFMRHTNSENNQTYEEAATDEDLRMKFRIGFNSVNTIRRQLLLTIDENASEAVDWAFDGEMNEDQIDDMYWLINDKAYIIQGSDKAEITTVYPLGILTSTAGINTIMIDDLEHVPDNFNVYLHDNLLDIYHDLKMSAYSIFLNAGEYHNRFEITFGSPEDILGIGNENRTPLDVLYANTIDKIVVVNPNQIDLKSISVFNMLGQSVYVIKDIEQNQHSEYRIPNFSAGTYIIKLHTATENVVTKKIIVD
ncbi:LamG-like jellyroll fold domain-containing protein [Winogradskyella vidalii]|uniref:LamG-like jellyroll fold domain-containing protein n=1 Tax=Winogradskyella vidalii TaxID=2615024 RepID=UPI0015C7A2C4|nr:LamG-like jellyroll fold domain-containing protein [Winogradskyella vidalii]